jgi:hypothetical protein
VLPFAVDWTGAPLSNIANAAYLSPTGAVVTAIFDGMNNK